MKTVKEQKLDEVFLWACRFGQFEVLKLAVEKGVDIHVHNDYGFEWACARGHLEVVKFLVEKGANIHANNDAGFRGACYNGHLEVVKFLVEKGVVIDEIWNEYSYPEKIVNYLKTQNKKIAITFKP